MSTEIASRARRVLGGLRSRRARALLSLGVVLGLGSVTTLAYWTDSAALTGGTFKSGTIDLKLDSVDNNPSSFSTGFAMNNMAPGQSKAVVVPVQNTGNVAFTYVASGISNNIAPNPGTLASLLDFKVVPLGTVSGSSPTQTCTGTGTFSGSLASSTSVVTTARTLAPGASENVCIQATLPAGTTTGQNNTANAVFTFTATSTP
ncbi:MAG: SipW-dependent-type signal peptide-containing protein [Nocardioides sp.]